MKWRGESQKELRRRIGKEKVLCQKQLLKSVTLISLECMH